MKQIFLSFLLFSQCIKAQQYAMPYSTSFERHNGYFYEYSPKYKQSNWVAYMLRGSDAKNKINPDLKFYNDDKLPAGAINNQAFVQRAFIPGQLKPSGDSRASSYEMHDAYLFANVSPMKASFDQVTWNIVENMVRGWAVVYDSIYIVSGPVFKDKEKIDTVGDNKIPVPDYFFKAVLVYNGIDMDAIGFILPNVDVKNEMKKDPVTIDSLEKFTGYDFFYQLPDYVEQHIESRLNLPFWTGVSSSYEIKKSMRKKEVQCIATDMMDSRCTKISTCINATCTIHGCEGEK